MKIEKRKIAELKPAPYNPRQSTKEQEQHLSESLKKFGCVEPIVINNHEGRENIIVGGHFRVRELKKLEQKEVDCVIVDLDEENENEEDDYKADDSIYKLNDNCYFPKKK